MTKKNLEDKYVKIAHELSLAMELMIINKVQGIETEYQFKIASNAMAVLLCDICYSLIKKDQPDMAKKLLDGIVSAAKFFLDSKYQTETKQ